MKAVSIKTHIDGKYKKTSSHIKSQLPNVLVDRYPAFVEFIEHYYKWMEREGSPLGDSYRLPEYLDIDKTRDDFLSFFYDEFMPNFPDNVLVDKRLLLKHITDFYATKGTENSFRFLFRILFNEEIEFEYPSTQLLRASDGIWVKETFVKAAFVEDSSFLSGRKIFGLESGATGYVDNVYKDNEQITSLKIKNLIGVFLPSETIETRDGLDKVTSYVSGQVRTVEVIDGGSGYFVGESITLDDGSFYEAGRIIVQTIDLDGAITSVEIKNTGSGYNSTYTKSNINSKGAILKIYIGGVYYDTGRFVTEQGKLNSICKLQDGNVYQDFSYVIKSSLPVREYVDYIMNTVHPAGMKFSGQTLLNDTVKHVPITLLNTEYDLEFRNSWITVNDLEKQNPGQLLSYYLDKLLNNYLYRVYIKTSGTEIVLHVDGDYILLDDGDGLITDDGYNFEINESTVVYTMLLENGDSFITEDGIDFEI